MLRIILIAIACLISQLGMAQTSLELRKLVRKVFNTVTSQLGVNGSDTQPLIFMEFNISEKREIDSVSVFCEDSLLAKAIKGEDFQQYGIQWDSLIPVEDSQYFKNKPIKLGVPVIVSMNLSTPEYSRQTVEAFLFKAMFKNEVSFSIKNVVLIKPILIEVGEVHR